MGKSKSYEIVEYRKRIMSEICKSKEIVRLLGCENEQYPEDVIPYKYAFPHEYVPEIITKTERYINFDISEVKNYGNGVFKNIDVYFFVVCHEDVVRYVEDDREYLWYDKAVCELDTIFSERDVLGVGGLEIYSNKVYSPKFEFKGRLLTFTTKDFTNGKRYGK